LLEGRSICVSLTTISSLGRSSRAVEAYGSKVFKQ
jgi:hypothetical protein